MWLKLTTPRSRVASSTDRASQAPQERSFDIIPKHKQQKKKINKLDFIKIKSFCAPRKWKDPQNGRNIWKSYILSNLCLENIKKLYNSIIKRQPIFLNEHKIWINIYPKNIYKCLISTWKDGQYHLSSGKCNSKPQWDTISNLKIKKSGYRCWWIRAEIRTLTHC